MSIQSEDDGGEESSSCHSLWLNRRRPASTVSMTTDTLCLYNSSFATFYLKKQAEAGGVGVGGHLGMYCVSLAGALVVEMTEVEPVLDFASSGRSGRRNALPDILGSPAGVNPSDLPLKLAELSLTDGPGGAQSPSSEEAPLASESSEGKDG
ncbi:hypothetical protein SRHO_G00015460 [Serrasalmus rhombeus]